MDKQKACEAIHNLGGCDATEEWSKGYDAGITAALDAIEKIPDTDNNADLISRSELQSEIAKGVGECRIRAFEPSVNCILQIIHRMPSVNGQPVNQWISVKERLPDEAEAEVLVWIEDGTADGIKIYDSLHIAYWYGDDKIFADLEDDEVKGVTHWMYTSAISEPPKDGDVG